MNIFSFIKLKKNIYLYNRNLKLFYLIHPLIYYYYSYNFKFCDIAQIRFLGGKEIENYTDSELEYYFHKYQYYQKNGVVANTNLQRLVDRRVSKELVSKNLANIPQIVLEVTDKCNLKCKYCGYGELYDFYDARRNINLDFERVKNCFLI